MQLERKHCMCFLARMPEKVVQNTFFSGGTILQWSIRYITLAFCDVDNINGVLKCPINDDKNGYH